MTAVARPVIKCVGGKTKLLPELLARVPEKFGAYHEPFVGGGALFWRLASEEKRRFLGSAFLSDSNRALVSIYASLMLDEQALIAALEAMPVTKEFFLELRKKKPDEMESDVERAAWFIFLNKNCFNGLYRVNKAGMFNTPWGDYKTRNVCDKDNLAACSRVLRQNAVVACQPFEKVLDRAERGDFVYLDCPYAPVSKTSSFTAYTSDGFGLADQERLRDVALRLKARGVQVLLSNSVAPQIRELYADKVFTVEEVEAPRAINSKADKRGNVQELLIR